jgi:dienelactone hydrolase
VAGVTWVIEQNADPASPMYQRIDTTHVGASGHSQGGFATTQAGANEHISTVAPIAGARTQRNLHGPALLICGGMDSTVPCSGIEDTFDGITNQPVMLANSLADGHNSWVSRSGQLSNVELAVVAWMRVHLMADTELRSWFYGASCKLCQDANWAVLQKDMDQ